MIAKFHRVAATVATATGLLLLAACGSTSSSSGDPLSAGSSGPSAAGAGAGAGSITVGSADFSENVLLADMYAGALEAKGVKVNKKLNIGAREVYLPALKDGSIDLIPEYTGTLLSYFDKGSSAATSSDAVYSALKAALPQGLSLLAMSPAQDKDTLAVTKKTAAKYKLSAIPDLASVAGQLTIGAGPAYRTRHTGLAGLKSVYGLTFKEFKPLDNGGVLTIKSLADGTVDVANVFSTDSSFKTRGFVPLADPKDLFLAENIVPVINAQKVTPTVTSALNALSARLTTENLTDLVSKVQIDKEDPAKVASEFLKANGLE